MNLNKEQQSAVETESTKALIIAGAGSGKTRVLIERIAYLIEHRKVSPYEIFTCTFSRAAANEMRERLEARLGNDAYKIEIGTMHGLSLKMLRRFGDLIGWKGKNITVYGDFEEQFLLKHIAKDLGYHTGKAWKKIKKGDVEAVFDKYYNTGREPQRFDEGYTLFKAFIDRCRENQSLTYGGLLIGLKLLIPHMAKHLHFKHIIIDETQDLNLIQWDIINGMYDAFKASLFVCGDISQSIYAWRGAVPEYLIEHGYQFDIYKLESNYRSDKAIVDAANSLISYNKVRLPLTMKAIRGNETKIVQIKNTDSAGIVNLIKSLNEKAPDIPRAVLCRIHGPLGKLSRLLQEEGIDHAYVGQKTKLTRSEEFARFHAFLKLIVNEMDNFAFLLIHDLIGITPQEYADIRVKAAQEGKSHFQAWIEPGIGWQRQFNLWYEEKFDRVVIELAHCGAEASWDIGDSSKFVLDWIEKNPTGTTQQYLDWLAIYDLQDEIAEEKQNLTLCTIHAAKGLEWPTVIIAGTNEGILPSAQAIKHDDIEGERRLCYVAITRAEDSLILTVRPERSEFNGHVKLSPKSRFLGEMQS